MHRIFLNNEVVTVICGKLRQEGNCHQDLASLALTCKAISDNALAALWYTQESLNPLLDCLPEGCTDTIENSDSPPTFSNPRRSWREMVRV